MCKEIGRVSEVIKNNNELMMKLTSTSILIIAAQEKVKQYLENNYIILQEILEDENTLEYFNLYYEENANELEQFARESEITSNEVEMILEKWREEDEF